VFKLTIEDDEGKTTVVPLARDEITIGRLEGNTIRLTERNVSRRHARLVRQNGALYIEDLTSFTGVRVNGTKIATPTPLHDGDEVQIGDYRLALRGERTDRTTAAITDRPTMPSMPAISAPMATVGGSVAIPTRASVAAMAAQPASAAAPQTGAAPAEMPQVDTAPLASGAPAAEPTPAPVPILTPPEAASPGAAAAQARRSQPQPVATPSPQPVPVPPPLGGHTPAYRAATPNSTKPAQPTPATPGRAAAQAQAVAGVPDISDAQPTIPIRALGESVPDRTAGTAPARMFVLTTDLAGLEFQLDRASAVIGRTDENDIVLGHRSISRHHAKIVRDGDHYTIVDLQSANGVRVNGEDYERIELNPGDIIELGHVKLRFVGPFETFVFRRASAGVKLHKLAAGAAIGLIALAAVVVVLRKRNATEAPPPPVAAVAPEPAAAPPPPPEPTPAVAPPAPAVPATPAAIFAEARQAVGVEDWDKARASLDQLANVDDVALRREVAALKRRVDVERQGSMLFAQFDEAASGKRYAEAMGRYEQIPADSVYKRRAKSRYEEARTLLVSEHMAAADRARTAGQCADVKSEVAEIVRLEPRNTIAREMVRLCRPKAAAVAAAPVAARPAKPRPSPTLTATDAPARAERPEPAKPAAAAPAGGEDGPDPDALMKQAREAWLRGQCGSAVDLSRKALHAKPGMNDAYQVIAVCSCTLKDVDAATRAYAKLDDKNRNLVRALCQKNGVTVGE
jgi:pSer/pThr/pTyr-binding forkhead associated (FHA) protein